MFSSTNQPERKRGAHKLTTYARNRLVMWMTEINQAELKQASRRVFEENPLEWMKIIARICPAAVNVQVDANITIGENPIVKLLDEIKKEKHADVITIPCSPTNN